MATIGRGIYAQAVHDFFDGVRSYDVERAVGTLADDADLQSPWGTVRGRDAIKEVLEALLAPSLERPSFTIRDIRGDGNVTTLEVSMSGRFGKAATPQTWRLLHLHGAIHHVVIQ